MNTGRTLAHRIARSYFLFALVLAGFFTFTAYLSVELIEEQLIHARLQETAERMVGQFRATGGVEKSDGVDFYVSETIPPGLAQAPPGTHELRLEGREVLALISGEGSERIAVVQDIDEYEHTEMVIFTALAAGFVSSLLLAVVLGRATARYVVAPVSALADAIAHDARPSALPSLLAEDEIGILARAFARRTDDLQQFLMRERLFTGDVSHELRTPLTIILGAGEVLTAQLADRPAERAAAERIRRVASDAAERVSALLLLSRSPDLLDAPRTSVNALLQTELDRAEHLLAGKPVQIQVEAPVEVWVDARRELVGIAIGNILRNACLHTDTGIITVRLSAGQLVIQDQGPGLPSAVRERLFERFVQGEDGAREGSGLGLSIVKRVVEHIGWDIRTETPVEGGSRFILSFPSPAAGAAT